MKKTISATLLVLLFLCPLFGCGREETPPIVYDSRVLINSEPMSDRLVYAGEFQTPTSGASILSSAFPEHRFFGTLSQSTITMHETYQTDDVVAEAPALRRALGLSEEEYRKQINVSENAMTVYVWEDAVLYCVAVSEEARYENEPVTYAEKHLFVEYREKTEESYLCVLSPEELYGGKTDALTSAYHGRVDDRYYDTYGYYDFSAHEYRHYETAADLPPYQGSAYSSARDVGKIVSEDALLNKHLNGVYSADSVYFLGDRIYATVVNGGRYHSEGSEPYEGTDLWTFMIDAADGEILYAECVHLENYWQGTTAMRLYRKGKNGLLYDLSLPLSAEQKGEGMP